MLCTWLHKFENVLSQVVTFEIWNPTFKNINNRLPAHGNRLLLCKTLIKLFGLLVIDYCLLIIDFQRIKTLVKDFSLKNYFGQIVIFNLFFEKLFLYLSWCFSWGFCISWVFSWILILDLSLWHHQNKLGKLCFHISSCPDCSLVLSTLIWNVQAFCIHSKLWSFCLYLSFLWAFFLRNFSTCSHLCFSIFCESFAKWRRAPLHRSLP